MVASLPFPDPLAFFSAFGVLPGQYPSVYWDAIDTLSRAALVTDFYVRPRAKVSSLEGAHGSKLVRPPWERLVPESDSMPRHFTDAAAIPSDDSPSLVRGRRSTSSPLSASASCAVMAYPSGVTPSLLLYLVLSSAFGHFQIISRP